MQLKKEPKVISSIICLQLLTCLLVRNGHSNSSNSSVRCILYLVYNSKSAPLLFILKGCNYISSQMYLCYNIYQEKGKADNYNDYSFPAV